MYLELLVVENKQLDRISTDNEVFLFLIYLFFIISAIPPVA